MNDYEISYLVDPRLEDDTRAEIDTAVEAEITGLGGTINESLPITRRRLRYPVGARAVAFLRTVQVQLPADTIEKLRVSLRKRDEILRVVILATARREEVPAEILEKYLLNRQRVQKPVAATPTEPRSTKKVTTKEVEKGIEKALSEEVK